MSIFRCGKLSGVAVGCPVLGAGIAALAFWALPKTYESTAVLTFPGPSPAGEAADSPARMAAELVSPAVLGAAAQRLGMPDLASRVRAETRGPLEVAILARGPDAKAASDTAWAVIHACNESRTAQDRKKSRESLDQIRAEIAEQEKKVERARQRLVEATKNYKPDDSPAPAKPDAAEAPRAPMSEAELRAGADKLVDRKKEARIELTRAPSVPRLPVSPRLDFMLGGGIGAGVAVWLVLSWLAGRRP